MIRFFLALSLLAATAGRLPAQEQSAQEPEQLPQLRGWIFPVGEQRQLALAVSNEEGEGPQILASTKEGALSANPGYASFVPGATRIELRSADEVLLSRSLALRPERFYTVVCWNAGGKWELRAFSDGPIENRAAERPLRVLNFVEGRATEFLVGDAPGEKVAANSIRETQILPRQFDVSIKVLDPQGGPPSQTSTAFDFAQADAAYLVVANDYLGRADPRVIAGGPSFVEPTAQVTSANVPPNPQEAIIEEQQLRSLEIEHRKAQLAALEASERGPNKIPNAAELKRQIADEIRKLREPAAPTPKESASVPR